MRIRALSHLAAPLLALALVAGCADAGQPKGDGALPTLTEEGLYPVLSAQAAPEGASMVTLALKQIPGGIELASVQGEITYDAATLQLDRATLPQGVEGDAFEVSPGRVRFVGTLVQGLTETPLLTLELRGREAPVTLTREMFSVQFEEVTGGAEFADYTAAVRSDRLLFVRSH